MNTSTTLGAKKPFGEEPRKPFAELTVEQKIDRLADALRSSRYTVHRVAQLENKIRQLKHHDHLNGKVVLNITDEDYHLSEALTLYDPLA